MAGYRREWFQNEAQYVVELAFNRLDHYGVRPEVEINYDIQCQFYDVLVHAWINGREVRFVDRVSVADYERWRTRDTTSGWLSGWIDRLQTKITSALSPASPVTPVRFREAATAAMRLAGHNDLVDTSFDEEADNGGWATVAVRDADGYRTFGDRAPVTEGLLEDYLRKMVARLIHFTPRTAPAPVRNPPVRVKAPVEKPRMRTPPIVEAAEPPLPIRAKRRIIL